jgi:hypothetical protein
VEPSDLSGCQPGEIFHGVAIPARMPDPESTPDSPPPGTPALPAGWAEKSDEILIKKPVYLRGWFIRLVVVVGLIGIAAAAVGGLFLYRWHRQQQAELDRQRRGVEAFGREADAQLVASINYAMLRPAIAGALLPEIAAAEKAKHLTPWPIELAPLPVSTAQHPARVRAAVRTATDLLAARGLTYDESRLAEARRVFLRLLTPHARTFLAENTGIAFPALFLDRHMQRTLITAYAARGGGTREEAEHAFVFYSIVGPALWQETSTPASQL